MGCINMRGNAAYRRCLVWLTVSVIGIPLWITRSPCWAQAGPVRHEDRSTNVPGDPPSKDDAGKRCDPSTFKIVVDIGHTIQAPGATSARGVTEYAFNTSLAKQIGKGLKDAGYVNTLLLTATGIGKRQLAERTARANAFGADLLLSVHHDDVQPMYYSTWTYNGKSHHFSDKFAGYSIFVSYENKYKYDSLAFAKLLGKEMLARDMLFSVHHSEHVRGEGRELIDPEHGVYRYALVCGAAKGN
jgi:N-acetylmuramoyl-L-alanine amidase